LASVIVLLVSLAVAAPAAAVKRRAFVTSTTGTGDISTWAGATGATSLDQADSVCRARAGAVGLPNASTYRAWMSTSLHDAYCHVQGLSGKKFTGCGGGAMPGGGPWYLVNGVTTFTAELDELVSLPYAIYRPVVFDESGNELVDAMIFTGTQWDGTVMPNDTCNDWLAPSGFLAMIGSSSRTSNAWTGGVATGCGGTGHLLCLEPGASEVVVQRWAPGAIVFVTSGDGKGDLGSWPEAGGATGIAAADAICQRFATLGRLPAPSSFVAWLSDDTVDAVDRITVDTSFRRLDGYPIAFSLADLTDGVASTSLHVDETGAYLYNNFGVTWTGTDAIGQGDPGTCDDWHDGVGSFIGRYGFANSARTGDWTDVGSLLCTSDAHLYCIGNRVTLSWNGFEPEQQLVNGWSATFP
jgi:hypothetical protein